MCFTSHPSCRCLNIFPLCDPLGKGKEKVSRLYYINYLQALVLVRVGSTSTQGARLSWQRLSGGRGHWSCSSGGDVFIGVLEIIIRYLVIITRVLARSNRPCPSIYTLLCDSCDVSHGVTETFVFCGSMFWLLYSPHKSDFPQFSSTQHFCCIFVFFIVCTKYLVSLYSVYFVKVLF